MSGKDSDFWNLIKKTIIKKNNLNLFKIKNFTLYFYKLYKKIITGINKIIIKK